MVLKLGEGVAEPSEIMLHNRRQKAEKNEPAEAVGEGLGHGRQPIERLPLGHPVEARIAGRSDDQNVPVSRKGEPRDQWRDAVRAATAAIDDEPSVGKAVET